jgi:hypothetical protein
MFLKRACYDAVMNPAKSSERKHAPRKNLITMDGTLDKLTRIHVAVNEKGKDASPFELRILHKDAVREHVDCSSAACYNGGFSLGELIRERVRGRQEEFIGTSFCTGQEGDPEESGPHPSCPTRFEIEATLRFR